MPIDREDADGQVFRNLGAGQSLGQQAQHLSLACGQSSSGRRRRYYRHRGRRLGGRCEECGRSLCAESLLWGHDPSLGPGGGKGLLTQLSAGGGH